MKDLKLGNMQHEFSCAVTRCEVDSIMQAIMWLYTAMKRNMLTRVEYDCLCDLLLIPKRIRYGGETFDYYKLEAYVESRIKVPACCDAFRNQARLAANAIHSITANKRMYVQYGNAVQIIDIMRAIWYNRIVDNLSRTNAIREALTAPAVQGLYVPLTFLYDFFNSEVYIGVFNTLMSPYATIKAIKDENVKDVETLTFAVYVGETLCNVRAVLDCFDTSIHSVCSYKAWTDYEDVLAQEKANIDFQGIDRLLDCINNTETVMDKPICDPDIKSNEVFDTLRCHNLTYKDIHGGLCDMSLVYFTLKTEHPIYKPINCLETFLESVTLQVFDNYVKDLRFYVKYSDRYMELPHCELSRECANVFRLAIYTKMQIRENAEATQLPECTLDYYLQTTDILDVVFDVPHLNKCNETMTQHEISRKGLPQGAAIKKLRVYSSGVKPVKEMRPTEELKNFLRYMINDNVKGRIWRNLAGNSLKRTTVLNNRYLYDCVVFEDEDYLNICQNRMSIYKLDRYLLDYGNSLDLIRTRLRFYVQFDDALTVEIPKCTISDEYVEELNGLLRKKRNTENVKSMKVKPKKLKRTKGKQDEEHNKADDTQYINGVAVPPPPEGLIIMPDNKDESIFTKSLSEIFGGFFN